MPPTGGDFLRLLLLQSGDVETNPGPPKRGARGAPKGGDRGSDQGSNSSKDDGLSNVGDRIVMDKYGLFDDCCNFTQALLNFDVNVEYMREYEDKIKNLEKTVASQKQEIDQLKTTVKALDGVDDKILQVSAKIDAITGVYDDLHEKMHEIDKARKNNLLFYGIKPDFLPEIPSQLEQKIHEIFKTSLHITRDVPCSKITRMISGPEVRGSRPVLVNFIHWKDREEVLRKSTFLRGTNIYVTEDLSRKMREHRQELHKYARQIRSRSPQKKCTIRSDKLFIDNHMYIFDEDKHEVVPFTRPPSPPRPNSRNYSSVDNELRRSASVHSVNGEALGPPDSANGRGGLLSPRGAPGSASSNFTNGDGGHASSNGHGGGRGKFASTESLHLGSITVTQNGANEDPIKEEHHHQLLDLKARPVTAPEPIPEEKEEEGAGKKAVKIKARQAEVKVKSEEVKVKPAEAKKTEVKKQEQKKQDEEKLKRENSKKDLKKEESRKEIKREDSKKELEKKEEPKVKVITESPKEEEPEDKGKEGSKEEVEARFTEVSKEPEVKVGMEEVKSEA